MPTPTYTQINSITLAVAAASVTFSSISQAYRDLILVVDASHNSSSDIEFRINADTGANYSVVWMGSYVSSTYSGANTYTYLRPDYTGASSGERYMVNLQLMDYSATDKHKTTLSRSNINAAITAAGAHRWANTAAITSIVCFTGSGTFNAGSSFTLYGIVG